MKIVEILIGLLPTAKKYWKEIAIILLIVLGALQTKRLNMAHERADKLDGDLKLKDGEIAKVTVELGRLRSIGPGGSTNHYLPPEAKVKIVFKEDEAVKVKLKQAEEELAAMMRDKEKYGDAIKKKEEEIAELKKAQVKMEVTGRTWGITAKPGLGALYSNKLLPEFDLKVLYVGRYSLKIGITPQFGDVGVSRHIDDLIPFLNLQNLEIQAVYGREFDNDTRWGVGVRVNL